MPPIAQGLLTRLDELVQHHGKRWKVIAQVIEQEGYRDDQGRVFTDNALRKKMRRRAGPNDEIEVPASSSKSSSDGFPLSEPVLEQASEPFPFSKNAAHYKRALANELLELLQQEGYLTSVIREVLAKDALLDATTRMPPQPDRITDRKWEKLAGTCDCALAKLFHKQRRELRLSVSQMLDYVLWNFFHRPRLSFQSGNAEVEEAGDEG
jgi:hypothetical protein